MTLPSSISQVPSAGYSESLDMLKSQRPFLWLNPRITDSASALAEVATLHSLGLADIEAADTLLRRWAPTLCELFPELLPSSGIIESSLDEIIDASAITGVTTEARTFIKCDHALPVAGSIKARGGIYEVLAFAEKLAFDQGIFDGKNPAILLEKQAKDLFGKYTVAVGSTGNLGLSIGIMASALGFHAVVHMSHDAKEWKKERLRRRGVEVIEHKGDYAAAVAAGRTQAAASKTSYFVDDENSRNLFLGYAVAALRLKAQFLEKGISFDIDHPLVVYLPCGVGGAPGGITFGLKYIFGDAVHCFFAEPTASPAMLVRMMSEAPRSVYDLGLNNITEADGLAVAEASELVFQLVHKLVAGVYTVSDDDLFRVLVNLRDQSGLEIEPSASAAFLGLRFLLREQGLEDTYLSKHEDRATHVFWTTGGSFVPKEEYEKFVEKGIELLAQDELIA